jgi:hypothetical protein
MRSLGAISTGMARNRSAHSRVRQISQSSSSLWLTQATASLRVSSGMGGIVVPMRW